LRAIGSMNLATKPSPLRAEKAMAISRA
jgi:hypothetical protein